MKQRYFTSGLFFLAIGLLLISCTSQTDEADLLIRAKDIHERVLTVDTHADTPSRLLREGWIIGEWHNPEERSSGCIDLPRMKEGGLDAEFFAVFVGQGERTPEGYVRAKERADRLLEALYQMEKDHPDLVEIATTPDDAYRLEKLGKRAAFIGMENGYPIGKDLEMVKYFYDRGVRYITLCHGGDNDICDSSFERRNPEDNGLTDFGKEVVSECNRLGIMVDVSHASDKSFFDILQTTKAPVIASHSSVRAICDHPRNLTDEMLKALAENGGVIQICFVSSFVKTPEPNPERDAATAQLEEKYGSRSDISDAETRKKWREEYMAIREKFPEERAAIKDIIDHIDHVVDLIGVDYVGMGTDFDGGGGVDGCDDVSDMPNITEELVRRGYSDEDIQKIWGGNLMRVFREVESSENQ
ncbi:MAG: dipeptidase [Candidatus Aminicenantaceae bacterium]